jgi:hypothetical protein
MPKGEAVEAGSMAWKSRHRCLRIDQDIELIRSDGDASTSIVFAWEKARKEVAEATLGISTRLLDRWDLSNVVTSS